MRLLYLVAHDPISPNAGGGASSLYYDQLRALSELGHEVHLWHFASAETRERFNHFIQGDRLTWTDVQQCCRSVQLSEYRDAEGLMGRTLGRMRSLFRPRLPVPRWSLLQELRNQMKRVTPDLIWAQHLEPALLAAQQSQMPVVYVHHDWLYRIKALRNHRETDPRQQAVEEQLVRSVSVVVSGSQPECEEIRRAGGRNVHYLPVSYEAVPLDLDRALQFQPRLVHLGGMGTTANREGLLAFFERVWPALQVSGVELEVIGDTAGASAALQQQLQTVQCVGFVKDLTAVLRPFDLHIIPWEHATGQRTRLPAAFNHAQIVVATRASVACYPEARDGENCRLVDRLEDMGAVINELLQDQEQRFRLGRSARLTFEQHFTRAALLPKFRELLDSIPGA